MNTITQILPSIVAFLSILISIYTLYVTRRKASRELHARFIERIVDRRIASYPELWKITAMAYRKPGQTKEEQQSLELVDQFHQQLWDWYYVKGYGIFMNDDTKNSFMDLLYALKNYEQDKGNEGIKRKSDRLRKELRADLKLEKRQRETTDI